MGMDFAVNQIYKDGNGTEYVLVWIDERGPDAMRCCMLLRKELPPTVPLRMTTEELTRRLENGEFAFCGVAGHVPLAITNKQRKVMEERMRLLKELPLTDRMITDRKCYNEELSKLITSGIARTTAARLIHQFQTGGMNAYALIPGYTQRGAKKGQSAKLSDYDYAAMEKIYEKEFLRTEHPKISECYSMLKNRFYIRDDYDPEQDRIGETGSIYKENIPSSDQFYYYISKRREEEYDRCQRKRQGMQQYNLTTRPVLARTDYLADAPGSCYFVDATPQDYYVADRYDRSVPLARPHLYFCIDGMSHLIVSFYISLKPECWKGYAMLLYNAFTSKKELCERSGVDYHENEWPAHHIPTVIYADNSSMKCINSGNLPNDLYIALENVEKNRGDLKALVENLFAQINTLILSKAPGRVIVKEEKDYVECAALTMPELIWLVIDFVLTHNKTALVKHTFLPDEAADHVKPNPIALWNWGRTNRAGCLRELPENVIKAALLPSGEAKATKRGLCFEKHNYIADYALEKGWFTRKEADGHRVAGLPKDQKIRVHFNPQFSDEIYFYAPDEQRFVIFKMCEHEAYVYGRTGSEERKQLEERLSVLEEEQEKEYADAIDRFRNRSEKLFEQAEKKANRDKKQAGGVRKKVSRIHKEDYKKEEEKDIMHTLHPCEKEKGNVLI